MWVADKWQDYEVLDTSGGEKLERWGNYLLIRPDPQVIWESPDPSGSPGHLGYAQRQTVEKAQRPLPPQQQGRRRVGIFRPARGMDHFLQGADLSFKALQLQAYGPLPRAGRQLGLVRRPHRQGSLGRAQRKGPQSLCLYRRRHGVRGSGGSLRDPCGRFQRHGGLGQGKRGQFRSGRCLHPLAGG